MFGRNNNSNGLRRNNQDRPFDGSGKGEGRGLGKIDGKCRNEK
jgi:hypothetical protein